MYLLPSIKVNDFGGAQYIICIISNTNSLERRSQA